MGNFTVIRDLGDALKTLLTNDQWSGVKPQPEITFQSPKEIQEIPVGEGNSNKVSLFLFRLLENQYLKNEELQRVNDATLQFPPLTLDLEYLITPYSENKDDEKIILGKVMDIFHDNPIVKVGGTGEEFKLLLNPISLDDMTKIWSTFQDVGYRLSVSYLVTPVQIDSTRPMEVQRVTSKEMSYAVMLPKREEE